jgi:hypothetical protein
MLHRTKPFNGTENTEIYRNCTHLKLTNRHGKEPKGPAAEELVILLTSQYSERQLPLGIFSDSRYKTDLPIAIEAINVFLDTVGRTEDNHPATVHTLYCTLEEYNRQCRESEASVTQGPCDLSLLNGSGSDHPYFDDSNDVMRRNSSSYASGVTSSVRSRSGTSAGSKDRCRSSTVSTVLGEGEEGGGYYEDNVQAVPYEESTECSSIKWAELDAVSLSNPSVHVTSFIQ